MMLVMSVDVERELEPRDGFLELKTFLKVRLVRFILLMIKVKRKIILLHKWRRTDTQIRDRNLNYTLKDATSFI
jgi:hypothetical protein